MKRFQWVILFLVLFGVPVWGAGFRDAGSLYSVYIPDNWIYQAKESSPELNVFYGSGEDELLYFEVLENVLAESSEAFATAALEFYAAPGGLPGFELVENLSAVEVDGVVGARCVYTYKDGKDRLLWEERIFLLLPDQRGFSLAYGSAGPRDDGSSLLSEIVRGWRWSFEN